jgi:hypothetical protein
MTRLTYFHRQHLAPPPKAPRKKSSRKVRNSADDTSCSIIHSKKIKSLESSKRKRKASEDVFDAEIQVASSLAQLGQKKAKKVVRKIVVATLQRVPSTFSDDEMTDDLRPTCFSSCLWCDLRFNVHRSYALGFENEFVDVETFSDGVLEVQEAPIGSAAAVDVKAKPSQAFAPEDRASPEFNEDLEWTVQASGDPIEDLPLVETREELPEGQDPSPSVVGFNETFGTSFRGELLSVNGEMAVVDGGGPKLSLLWKSLKFVDETKEGVPKKKSRLTGETPSTAEKHFSVVEKHVSLSVQKSDDF